MAHRKARLTRKYPLNLRKPFAFSPSPALASQKQQQTRAATNGPPQRHSGLCLEGLAAAALRFGVRIVKLPLGLQRCVHVVHLRARQKHERVPGHQHAHAFLFHHRVRRLNLTGTQMHTSPRQMSHPVSVARRNERGAEAGPYLVGVGHDIGPAITPAHFGANAQTHTVFAIAQQLLQPFRRLVRLPDTQCWFCC